MFQFTNQMGAGYNPENPAFLQSNRLGLLHPQQKSLLEVETSGLVSYRQTSMGQRVPVPQLGGLLTFFVSRMFTIGCLIVFLIPFLLAILISETSSSALFLPAIGLLLIIVVISLIAWYRKRKTTSMLKNALETGRVEQTTARLEFKKNWQVTSPEGPLRLPWFFPLSAMEPGKTYTVYYLPNIRYVLSIETDSSNSLGVIASQREKDESYTQILGEVFGFISQALPENRQGRLHPAQKKQVLSRFALQMLLLLIILGGLLFFAIREKNDSLFLLSGAALIFIILRAISNAGYIRLGTVLSVQGEGRKYTREKTSHDDGNITIEYYIKVGHQEFEVNHKQYNAFLPGKTYRVYYLPPKTLVNIEVL